MSRRTQVAFLFIATLLVVVVSAAIVRAAEDDWKAPARAEARKNPIAADDRSIAAGKQLYAHHCRTCHGESGKGDGPSAGDLDTAPCDLGAARIAEQSDGALFWKITEGRRPMPAFARKTTEEQRWEVINYIRTFARKS